MTTSREIRLKQRPVGMPKPADFEAATVDVPAPGPGEVQVRNRWMAIDPAMRGRMVDAKSYRAPFALGAPMEGPALGDVLASNDPAFKPGDTVKSLLGFREVFNASPAALEKVETHGIPPQAFLGALGTTGYTAYIGLMKIAALKPGDVVFVSAAAGAVGSVACQIAKIKGHKVIGSAGGPAKCAYLRDDLKLDGVIDYKAEKSLTKALATAAPNGIDVYFDNVGGDHLQAAIAVANRFARFAICGMISQYNATEPTPAPRNLMLMMGKGIRMEGYIQLFHPELWPDFTRDSLAWYRAGKLTWRETVYEGIDRSIDAFLGLFAGENIGKMLVKF